MRFKLIDGVKKEFPIHRLCNIFGVSESGYFAWKERPTSRGQNEDMVLLSDIRSHFSASNGTYGAPRMHAELKDEGLAVGRHRVARLMRDNGLKALQKRRYKKTTDSNHGGSVAVNLLDQDFGCGGPDQKWVPTSATSGRPRAGFIWRSCSTFIPAALSDRRRAAG